MTEFRCEQLEQTLRDQDAALLTAARCHAVSCARCRAELDAWDSLSMAARSLRRDWESPGLWERIQESLSLETQPKPTFWHVWRFAFAAAAVVIISVGVVWTIHHPSPDTAEGRLFLTERALAEAKLSESAYVQSIDKLSRLAQPVMDKTASPLMDSYREKLTLLDTAIAELRAEAERNTLNARLRVELVNLYQEKQKTLTEVLAYANNSSTAR